MGDGIGPEEGRIVFGLKRIIAFTIMTKTKI